MDKIEFKKTLFKVAFCTMACDGDIDEREIEEMKIMDKNTSFFESIDLSDELEILLSDLDTKGIKVISELFTTLHEEKLNVVQELLILEVALRIINADEKHDDNEVRFIRLLRGKLELHDETIRDRFGVVELLNPNSSIEIIAPKTTTEFVMPTIEELKDIDFKDKKFDKD